MKKIFFAVVLALLLFIIGNVSAVTNTQLKGELQIVLDKQQYNAGETINAEIIVTNGETTPIANAIVLVEIVQGENPYTPSHISDLDNIFVEEKISGINLLPLETKKLNYSFALPTDLQKGSYRIDAYFKTDIVNIVGIPHLFNVAQTARFTVNGNGDWPNLKIIRSKTELNGLPGQIGAETVPGSIIKGKIVIANLSEKKSENISLVLGIYDWDDTAGQKISEKTINVNSIEAKSEKEVEIELQAPSMPNAYAIRIETKQANKLVSFYRGRSIVTGETTKVRNIIVNNFEFQTGQELKIKTVIGPSPDHYTFPVSKGFELKTTVEDLDKKTIIFTDSKTIEELSIEAIVAKDYPEKESSFIVKEALSHFLVCNSTEKNSVTFDKKCIEYDASKFTKIKPEPKITANWKFGFAKNSLAITFCNERKEDMNAEFVLIEKGKTEILLEGILTGKDCIEKSIDLQPSNLELIIANYVTKRQNTIEIKLKENENQFAGEKCSELKGTECSATEQCNEATQRTSDVTQCCLAKCKPIGTSSGTIVMPTLQIQLIAAIVAIIIVIIGIIAWLGKQKSEGLE